MVGIYCRGVHSQPVELCRECALLLEYAEARTRKCPFGEGKPVCRKCTVHCYSPEKRDAIKRVMRYSGPRMLYHNPVLAIRHLLHIFKSPHSSQYNK